ncbi:MAG: heparinase II/III family protein [Gemmatimonas sp.]
MSVLLSFDADKRRALAAGALAPLVRALRVELDPLVDGRLSIPVQKARLTRRGGRCEFDGTMLSFDPWSPHEHTCPQCHRIFMDGTHDDWWAMGAQLWVAERAAQAAALQLVTGEQAMGAVALRILGELADRYETWPNKDNALGPTRPFFSTYLESIWLINLCHAIALLEQHDNSASNILLHARSKLVRPSRDLIASFHEGRSNRQVWNEVAILSASRILDDDEECKARIASQHGLFDLLANGLLDDGTWYEGENYHLFAHRGLWYGVQLLRAANVSIPAELEERYRAGFVTPFLGVLPDDTIPSRRDSQYKVSIRQWRFAEWCEMGIAHAQSHHLAPDARLVGTLHRLYHPDNADQLQAQHRHPFSTADAERNEPAGLLSRADLSWRSLLMTTPVLLDGNSWSPGSVCLPQQGLAVIRREAGKTYVALEGGHTGGGHGHPDRLALTVQRGHDRWFEDPGTGSYVEQKLHWYRSTLAHAAPLVDGASQDAVPARLLAFEDRGGAGWMCKRVENMKPGVNVQRTIVVCDGYFIDLLEWESNRTVQIDLPVPRSFQIGRLIYTEPADPHGAGGLEDGFDFLTDVEVDAHPLKSTSSGATASRPLDEDCLESLHYAANTHVQIWRAEAPGAPGQERGPLHWLRMNAAKGCLIGIGSWIDLDKTFTSINADGMQTIAVTLGETESIHTRTSLGWHIALKARHATSSIDLSYLPQPETAREALQYTVVADAVHVADVTEVADVTGTANVAGPANVRAAESYVPGVVHQLAQHPQSIVFELGEQQYRRTEQTWTEASEPKALIAVLVNDTMLEISAYGITDDIVVPTEHEENLLDNERRDVNADGVELFIGTHPGAPWSGSWLAVPANENISPDEPNRARSTVTTSGSPAATVTWSEIAIDARKGFMIQFQIPISAIATASDGTFVMEVIVNERPRDRRRRRGQLVLSGGGGFGYLRGDRADSDRALTFRLPPGVRSHRL